MVKDATAHLSTLVRAEVELAKAEVTKEVKRGLMGSVFFIVALTVVLYATVFFFIAGAELIADSRIVSRGFAYLIVFGVMLLIAVLFAFLGYRKVKKIRAPRRTIDSVKETASALTHRNETQP